MTLDEARTLMHEWVASLSLRAHMEAVSACMGAYAALLDPTHEERWRVAGLLHDFDYERHPTPAEHPFVGVKELERLGVEADVREAILGHAQYSGTPRATPMARCLFAVDELSGFIVACAKVRPNGIGDLEVRSVRKKLKDRSFAAGVSREDIAAGLAEFGPVGGVDEAGHLEFCIAAIRGEREQIGV